MRRFMRKNASAITSAIVAATLTGGLFALSEPPEDGRNFDCTRHGNEMCGITLDKTPNKPGGKVRLILDFDKDPRGNAIGYVRPFGPGTR